MYQNVFIPLVEMCFSFFLRMKSLEVESVKEEEEDLFLETKKT